MALVFTGWLNAQERTLIKGEILNKSIDVAALTVVNLNTSLGTITGANGFFEIPVRIGDTIAVRGVQFNTEEVVITKKIMDLQLLQVFLVSEINQLDTVQLSNSILTGDVTKDGSTADLDPAKINNNPDSSNPISTESRRLHTATSRPVDQVGQQNLRFDFSLDRILNAISGRTKRLKKAVAISEYQKKVDKVRSYYSDSLFMTTLHIPKQYIDDFTMWVLDDEELLKDPRLDNKLYALEYFMTRWEAYKALVENQEGVLIKPD